MHIYTDAKHIHTHSALDSPPSFEKKERRVNMRNSTPVTTKKKMR